MIVRYEDAFLAIGTLSLEEAKLAHEKLLENANLQDEDFQEIYTDFVNHAVAYANIRGKWSNMTGDERDKTDSFRTQAHNLVMSDLDIMERLMVRDDRDTSWRDILQREKIGAPRKRQGDFACYIAFITSVAAR